MPAPKPARLTRPSRAQHLDENRRTVYVHGVVRMLVDTGAKGPARHAVDLSVDEAVELAEELLATARIVRRLAQEQQS